MVAVGCRCSAFKKENFTEAQMFCFLDKQTVDEQKRSPNIQPSLLKLKMRPNFEETITFKAQKSEIPVDMYFLFDLSKTMETDLKNLATIAEDLASELAEITSDRNFGFGIFREKPTPPFDISRDYDHDFEHHMSLTPDIAAFSKSVASTVNIVGNMDNPEAGFDALMQVLLCKEEIGWRNGTTHIIVYISDATPHTAGDGFLGGTWKAYDQRCQLQNKGNMMVYHSLEHDYPSFSAVSHQLRKQAKFLVMGLKSYIKGYYENLMKLGALEASIGIIDSNDNTPSESLKKLILGKYRQIKGKLILELDTFSMTRNVQASLQVSAQTGRGAQCQEIGKDGLAVSCSNVRVGESATFELKFHITEQACNFSSERVDVKIFGQESSRLSITIEPDCVCDCMKEASTSRNDQFCSGRGKEKCGTCYCQEDFYGDNCECSKEETNSASNSDGIKKCRSETGLICNDRGSCSCGTCLCSNPFIGKFCECDLRDCNCGQHGYCSTCDRGKPQCTCEEGWTQGSSGLCDCSSRQDRCVDPFTNSVCNGNGKCKCNQCVCDGFDGDFCQKPYAEEFTDVQERSCEQLSHCILLDTFGHLLLQHDNDKDKGLLTELEKACADTKLKANDRIECFWALNDTDIGSTQDTTAESQGDWIENYQGTTKACEGILVFVDTTNLQQCTAWFKGCPLIFWHNADKGVDGYTQTDYMTKISIYLKYYNKTDNPLIKNNGNFDLDYDLTAAICPGTIDKWLVIGIAGGVVVFIFIVCFTAYIVLINLYDRWEYERFKQDTANVWNMGNVQENQMGTERQNSKLSDRIRNRMSRMSVRQ